MVSVTSEMRQNGPFTIRRTRNHGPIGRTASTQRGEVKLASTTCHIMATRVGGQTSTYEFVQSGDARPINGFPFWRVREGFYNRSIF